MRIAILISGVGLTLASALVGATPAAHARSNATMSRQNNPGYSASMGYGQRQDLPPPGAAVATRGPLRVRVACEGLPMTVCRRHGLRFGSPLLPRTSKDTASLAPRLSR